MQVAQKYNSWKCSECGQWSYNTTNRCNVCNEKRYTGSPQEILVAREMQYVEDEYWKILALARNEYVD